MYRRITVACLAAVGALLYLTVGTAAQQKPGRKPNAKKPSEIYVIVKARLYEVDQAFHKQVAKARWLSRADLEERETKPQADSKLFARLKKMKPTLTGKVINIDPGKEGVLLTATSAVNRLPTPDQLRRGKTAAQTFAEGFTLSAHVHISADRRFVRARFLEKSLEIDGVEKIKVVVDKEGSEAVGELVFTKEARFSWTRYIPDGGSILLPLHYRSRAARKKDRWLVAEVTPLIHIEEEERERRGQGGK